MATKSSTASSPAKLQETPPLSLIKAELDEIIARRKKQGEYNVDSKDILRIAELFRQMMDNWP